MPKVFTSTTQAWELAEADHPMVNDYRSSDLKVGLGVNTVDGSVWIRFLPCHLPALRELVAALEAKVSADEPAEKAVA